MSSSSGAVPADGPLSPEASALASPKYAAFTIHTTSYKSVNATPVPVHIFIPRGLNTSSPVPVLVRFHGGFLITGAALFPDFVAQWSLDYCLAQNAIWVAPDYRLLPEASGLDVLDDLKDFWTWTQKDLKSYLGGIGRSEVKPDLGKVLVYGESAGGWLAVQSALTQPVTVKAIIAAFPMLEVDAPWYSVKADGKRPFGAPEISKTFLDKHIADIPKDAVVTAGYPPDRIPLALVAIQQGLFTEMLGKDESLYPLRVLEKIKADETLPYVFTFHGTNDQAVPWEGTEKFANTWKEKFGDDSIYAYFAPGDHGLDTYETMETEWLKKGLDAVTKAWLA